MKYAIFVIVWQEEFLKLIIKTKIELNKFTFKLNKVYINICKTMFLNKE